jgi:hypothetical protein
MMSSDFIDDAVRVLRQLPEEVQLAVARGIVAYAERDEALFGF